MKYQEALMRFVQIRDMFIKAHLETTQAYRTFWNLPMKEYVFMEPKEAFEMLCKKYNKEENNP